VDVLSISALLLSLLALAVSTRLAVKQQAMQRHANTLPALSLLLAEFRSANFHESYEYVCSRLQEHPAECGISGLPREARRHVYAVCYLYQHLGELVRLGVVNERELLIPARNRLTAVWSAVQPFVLSERANKLVAGPDVLRVLEVFAERAQALPPDSYARALHHWRSRPLS
jgi:hypothetical protein